MIFTPWRGGISRNEKEDIELERTIPAVNVLLHAVLAEHDAEKWVPVFGKHHAPAIT